MVDAEETGITEIGGDMKTYITLDYWGCVIRICKAIFNVQVFEMKIQTGKTVLLD